MNTPLNPRIDTKTRNKLLLLGELRRTGATSRVDLAAKLGFTKSAVTLLTNELLEEGVLLEKEDASNQQQRRGRRRVMLSIDPNCRLLFGAVIEERSLAFGLSNLHGDSLEHVRIDTEKMNYREILSAVVEQVQRMRRDNCIPEDRILGLGITMSSGAVRLIEGSGSVEKLARLKRDLSRAMTMPVITARTGSGALLAQRLFAGESARHTVFLRNGGEEQAEVGILVGGRPYSGAHGRLGLTHGTAENETAAVRTAQAAALYAQLLDPERIFLCGDDISAPAAVKEISGKAAALAGRPVAVRAALIQEENLHLCGCAIAAERCFYFDSMAGSGHEIRP